MFRFNVLCTLLLPPLCKCLMFRDPVTIPDQGTIAGVEVSKSRIQKIVAYYGIPYAQPPVDHLRFSPPITDQLPEVTNNSGYLPACVQTEEAYKESETPLLQLVTDLKNLNISEDCLYLNVFVPLGSHQEPFATIIWFHPGNFLIGSPDSWNPHTLVYRQRVIVVTIAWRLNIFGFLTTLDGEAPGNYGLLDQQAAMQWVKNNIKLFGGDSDNISLMGYGAGATSIGLHMTNPKSSTLFNKAIAMSGDYLSPSAIKMPEEERQFLDYLAKELECTRRPVSTLLKCLRNAEAKTLLEIAGKRPWRPLLDGLLVNSSYQPFLSEHPRTVFESGTATMVPLLTGYTHMEQVLDVPELNNNITLSSESLKTLLAKLMQQEIPVNNNTESSCTYNPDHIVDAVTFFYGPEMPLKDMNEYRQIVSDFVTEKNFAAPTFLLASYISKEQPVYMYRIDMKPSTSSVVSQIPDWVSVPHLFDLIYVWGVPYWEKTGHEWDIRDKRISDTIMSLWTNFVKFSDPTAHAIFPIKWKAFTKENPGILIIDTNFAMSNTNNLNYKAFEFWNHYYPKIKDVATTCCELSDSGARGMYELNLFFCTVFSLAVFNIFSN